MALNVSSVSPAIVPYDGGYRIEIAGTFVVGHRMQFHLGVLGSAFDPSCYSGVPGQGATVYPDSTVLAVAYTPLLPAGELIILFAKDLDTSETDTLASAVAVLLPSYDLATFGLRAVLPPHWLTGPRRMEQV